MNLKQKQKVVRLSESDLHKVIKNATEQIIRENMENEGFFDAFKGAAKKIGGDVKQGTQNAYGKMKQGVQNAYGNVKQGVQNAYGNMKQYAQDVQAAGQEASNIADAQRAIAVIQDLVQKKILGQNIANMVIGTLKKYGNK